MRIVHAEELRTREHLHVEGARIVGTLDLTDAKLAKPLVLRDCHVEERIVLRRAEVPSVDLTGSHLWGVDADRLRTNDDVDLSGVVTTGRAVSLVGARLGGSLLLNGARLSNLNGYALNATGIAVEQSVLGEFTANGHLTLSGADIKGSVDLTGSRLFNPAGIALGAVRTHVGQNLTLRGARTTGQVVVVGAHVEGNLSFAGAHLANSTREALVANGLTVGLDATFNGGFRAGGTIRLTSASIGGWLDFGGASVRGLFAEHLSVGLGVNCSSGFTSTGELRLRSAHIRGDLLIAGATLANRGDIALDADNLVADQDVVIDGTVITGTLSMIDTRVAGKLYVHGSRLAAAHAVALQANGAEIRRALLCSDSTVDGEVWLVGAHTAYLGFPGTTITNPGGVALRAPRVRVDTDAELVNGFTAVGKVDLVDAAIGGSLDFDDAVLDDVDLTGARAAKLRLLPRRAPDQVDLTNAKVGDFEDDPATWPKALWLRGFGYDVLDDMPVRERVRWLRRHEGGYTPGLYDTLAVAHKRSGRVEYARRVDIAKQWHRRTEMNPLGKALNWLLYLTVGYGYRTSLAWVWLAALLATGTVVFAGAHPAEIVPATSSPSEFQPFVYALDVLLPIVDLGQQKDWVAKGQARWWSWGLIAAGWILTTTVVAGLTNALRRD